MPTTSTYIYSPILSNETSSTGNHGSVFHWLISSYIWSFHVYLPATSNSHRCHRIPWLLHTTQMVCRWTPLQKYLHTYSLTSRNDEVSHITSGYWYNSAANGKVRVDETYDGAYGSSLFDYTNMSSTGAFSNHQIIVGPSIGSAPSCFDDYVENPGFPLVTADFLQTYNASFGGIVQEPFLGEVQTVSSPFKLGLCYSICSSCEDTYPSKYYTIVLLLH